MKKLNAEITYSLVGLALIILSLISTESLDIAMHDSYIVIANWQIFLVLAILFFLFAGISWGLKKVGRPLNKRFSWIHRIITTLSIAVSVGLAIFSLTNQPKRFYRDYSIYEEFESSTNLPDINTWIAIVIIIGLLIQLVFIANVLFVLIKRKKKS